MVIVVCVRCVCVVRHAFCALSNNLLLACVYIANIRIKCIVCVCVCCVCSRLHMLMGTIAVWLPFYQWPWFRNSRQHCKMPIRNNNNNNERNPDDPPSNEQEEFDVPVRSDDFCCARSFGRRTCTQSSLLLLKQ